MRISQCTCRDHAIGGQRNLFTDITEMTVTSTPHKTSTSCVVPPKTPLGGYDALSTPVYRASTIVFPDAAAYRNRFSRAPDGYTYGLSGTPTARTLEMQLSEIQGAERTILTPSGQSAISTVMLTLLRSGDHLLVTDNTYPPVKQFAEEVLVPFGVSVDYFDPCTPEDLRAKVIKGKTRLVWLESPGSTTMEVADIDLLSTIAHEAGALVGCDNTWSTGLLFRPLDHGVDFSMEALTKYVGGHSDILMGAVSVRDMEHYTALRRTLSSFGVGVSPDECSLALRGMQTMALRLEHSGQVAMILARELAERPEIGAVLHPGLPGAVGHEIWKRDFAGSSGVFTLRLDGISNDRVDAALDSLRTFAIGASWGGTRSLMAPQSLKGGRQIMPVQEETTYMRLSIGLESIDDLRTDIENMLAAMTS